MALRRNISLAIISILVFNCLGYFVCALVQRQMIREEAEEQIKRILPDARLNLISIPLSNTVLCNEASEGEFSLNGKMYDVARTTATNDTLYCYCLDDRAETEFLTNFNTNDGFNVQSSARLANMPDLKISLKNGFDTYFQARVSLPEHSLPAHTFISRPDIKPVGGFPDTGYPPPRLT